MYTTREKPALKKSFISTPPNPTAPSASSPTLPNSTIGWHHQIEIEEGVEKMYKWYVEQDKR